WGAPPKLAGLPEGGSALWAIAQGLTARRLRHPNANPQAMAPARPGLCTKPSNKPATTQNNCCSSFAVKAPEAHIATFGRKHSPGWTLSRHWPTGGQFMEMYEIRVLTKKHASDTVYSSSRINSHAAMRQALAVAAPCEAIVEVWCGARCV